MSLNLATVYQQVPEQHGVLVVWRNLQHQGNPDAGKPGTPGEKCGFVRVGVPRAHPSGGSVTDLPGVGELGLVATIDEEVSVWLCSMHWLDDNAITPGLQMRRSDGGIVVQENANGEAQIDLPGGITLRSTILDAPLVLPPSDNISGPDCGLTTFLSLDHPSGLSIKVSPLGDVTIDRAGSVALTAVNPISITGYGTFNLQTLPIGSNPNAAQDWPVGYTQPSMDITVNSGGKVNLTSAGDTNVTASGSGKVNVNSGGDTVVNAGGNLALNATGTVNIQGGGSKFVMEGLVTWAKNHTHTSASSGSPTSAPLVDPTATAAYLSKSTLQGLHG